MPKSVPGKRVYRKTSETQEIIFEIALSLMSEKGFQGTTVREICAKAGIPIGTFYNCYPSKVDILKRIYDNGDAYMTSAVEREAAGKSALDKLRIFGKYYARLNTETGIEVMRVLYYPANEWFSYDRPMQTFIRSVIAQGQAAGEIRSDLSAEQIESSFFDVLRGICYNWCVYGGSFDMEERISVSLQLLCESISRK